MNVLSDEQQIKNLLFEVAERRDRGDLRGVAELFAHATFETHYPAGYPGVGVAADVASARAPGGHGRQTGIDEIEELFRAAMQIYDDGLPHTQYLTTNLILEIDEATATAEARSYYVVFQSLADFPLQPISAGRYRDRFERVDEQWRFRSRDIYADHSGDLSHHLTMDPLAYGERFKR